MPAALAIVDYFGLKLDILTDDYEDEDTEKIWDDIGIATDKIAGELNELSNLDGKFYFASIGDSEDFGLQYVWWENSEVDSVDSEVD